MGRKRRRLAERRKAVGLSQERLAEAVGVDPSTVARWERGETDPQPVHRPRLADVLGVSVEEIGDLLTGASTAASQTDDRLRYVLQQPGRVDLVTAVQLRKRVDDLDLRYITTPPTMLLTEAIECFHQTTALRAAANSLVRRELLSIEAEAAILLGQLIWDASHRRDHTTARAYLHHAVAAARESGHDQTSQSWALLRLAMVALYGEKDPTTGLDLARQAAATSGRSHVLAGLATLHAAEAHAMQQQRNDCEHALGHAETSFAQITPSDPAIELYTPTHHGRMAGSCHLFLGNNRRALAHLETTARQARDGSKAHAIVLGNLALAHLRERELDQAVAALHQALNLVEATRGGGGLTIVFAAGRELQPWRQEPAVQEVHDRLLGLIAS